jgi:hypothetical protein
MVAPVVGAVISVGVAGGRRGLKTFNFTAVLRSLDGSFEKNYTIKWKQNSLPVNRNR